MRNVFLNKNEESQTGQQTVGERIAHMFSAAIRRLENRMENEDLSAEERDGCQQGVVILKRMSNRPQWTENWFLTTLDQFMDKTSPEFRMQVSAFTALRTWRLKRFFQTDFLMMKKTILSFGVSFPPALEALHAEVAELKRNKIALFKQDGRFTYAATLEPKKLETD